MDVDGKPYGIGGGALDAMPLLFWNQEVIPGFERHGDRLSVVQGQARLSFQQDHPLVPILIIPEIRRTRGAVGHDAFDVHALGLKQRFENFIAFGDGGSVEQVGERDHLNAVGMPGENATGFLAGDVWKVFCVRRGVLRSFLVTSTLMLAAATASGDGAACQQEKQGTVRFGDNDEDAVGGKALRVPQQSGGGDVGEVEVVEAVC